MSIFLGNLTNIEGTKNRVGLIHNMPLDPINGIKHEDGALFSVEELNKIGALVDSIPEPIIPNGQQVSAMYVDTATLAITYDYLPIPQSDADKLAELQSQNAQMLLALVMGGLM